MVRWFPSTPFHLEDHGSSKHHLGAYDNATGRVAGFSPSQTHRIHGAGIFTYIWLTFMVNVGKYNSHGFYGQVTFWGIFSELQLELEVSHSGKSLGNESP